MEIQRNQDGSATLICPQGSFQFTADEFDDLVHVAWPISTTHLYRLLIDTLVEGDERKQQLRGIIEATGSADAQLQAIQEAAMKHLPGGDA
jgi:hypothetical protein